MTMMPEGPEVRTLSDSISSLLTATPHELKAVTVLSGRYHPPNKEPADFTAFTESLTVATDNTITSWSCKGKFQYVSLPSQRSVWITLGMSGRFIFDNPHHRHARVNFLVEDVATRQTRDLTFVDARQFGTVKCCMNDKELEKKLASIGPDILADITMTGDDFLAVVKKQRNRMNTSKFLMNQQKLSGVGNYILAEGLYKAVVDPWSDIKDLDEDTLRKLFEALQSTAAQSLKSQGATLKRGGSYRQLDDAVGEFTFQLECYGRSETPTGEPVLKIVDGPHKRAIHFTWKQVGEENRNMVKRLLGPKLYDDY